MNLNWSIFIFVIILSVIHTTLCQINKGRFMLIQFYMIERRLTLLNTLVSRINVQAHIHMAMYAYMVILGLFGYYIKIYFLFYVQGDLHLCHSDSFESMTLKKSDIKNVFY